MSTKYKCNCGCNKTYRNQYDLDRHQRKNPKQRCPICDKEFSRKDKVQLHMARLHPEGHLKCQVCPQTFSSNDDFVTHVMEVHAPTMKRKVEHEIQAPPAKSPKITEHSTGQPARTEDVEMMDMDILHRKQINTFTSHSSRQSVYNVKISEFDLNVLDSTLDQILADQKDAFRINLACGFILQQKITGQLRYFYTSANNFMLLDEPMPVGNGDDLQLVKAALQSKDLYNRLLNNRPDTSYAFFKLTNITFFVTKLHKHPVGALETGGDPMIVDYIKASMSIRSFDTNHRGQEADDKLCVFRCLAERLRQGNQPIRALTISLFNRWCNHRDIVNRDAFAGITVDQMPELERIIGTNISVYTLVNDVDTDSEASPCEEVDERPPISAQLVQYTLRPNMGQPVNLLFYSGHCHLITNLNSVCKSWRCNNCKRYFKDHHNMNRHVKEVRCEQVQRKYPGGGYGQKKTIFVELSDEGIDVSDADRFYPFRAVYDFECFFEKIPEAGDRLKFTHKLVPVSCSVASNVPGFQHDEAFINDSPQQLVNDFYTYLTAISNKAQELMTAKYQTCSNQIQDKCDELCAHREELENIPNKDCPRAMDLKHKIADLNRWHSLKQRFNKWLHQLPVIGFNSGKFDLNLIREQFLTHVYSVEHEAPKVVKRGNSFMSISLPGLHFLDMTNYLAAGTSYAKWLKALQIDEEKGFWPYEWFTSYDQLAQTHLPPKEAYHSTLKNSNITDEDYQKMRNIWHQKCFRTMKDCLIWYNNLDVGPFLKAVAKMAEHFKDMQIDIFKQGAISLPGLAMLHMFANQEPDNFFALFNEKEKHWLDMIKRNIVGGPSIIFHRRHEAGGTKIRNGNPVKSILGFDANALYLYCTGLDMPTGLMTSWTLKNQSTHDIPTQPVDDPNLQQKINRNLNICFDKSRDDGFSELSWVVWEFRRQQSLHPTKKLTLQHARNGGQKRFFIRGKAIFVDGWIPELGMVLQYHGCAAHGHNCELGWRYLSAQSIKELTEETERITTGLKEHKIVREVKEMYECAYTEECKHNPEAKSYRDSRKKWTPGAMTGRKMLEAVMEDQFFGVVECDIQVPWWTPELREKMAEMPPIFKNTEVSRKDLGEYMEKYAEDNDVMATPRRCLIGSYFGRKIAITTPLLKWYLNRGLIVTRIYSALQYQAKRVFRNLADEVTQHRIAADQNQDQKILAELFKLLGNSYYGKTCTNKDKHVTIKYCVEAEAADLVNSPLFRKLEMISEDVYEVTSAQKNIVYDLPITIGFFVYSYAKLRMLEFYYDFLLQVLDPMDFQLMEMDTDSLYFACAAESLEEAVRPTKLTLFKQLKPLFMALHTNPNDPLYDQRKPGLFKLEWKGDGMIALNSKTYIGWSDAGYKTSTKGLSKTTNSFGADDFRAVLENRVSVAGTNYGFRQHKGDLKRYTQVRNGLTFLYPKRKVLSDGESTEPLDI